MIVNWIPTDQMTADIFTKNLAGPLFEFHGSKLFGEDEYMTGKAPWSTT